MAFLDNSGDIILDAVLTDAGRKRMARGEFTITKFAFSDEEINYADYDPSHASGSAFFDLTIMQTPILEAFTNNSSLMRTKLLTFNRQNILHMPIFKLNEKAEGPTNIENKTMGSPNSGSFGIIVNQATATPDAGDNPFTAERFAQGLMLGYPNVMPSDRRNRYIAIDQGIDGSGSDNMTIKDDMDTDLVEKAYLVRLDNRLLHLHGYAGTDNYVAFDSSFIDDDNIATYYIPATNDIVLKSRQGARAGLNQAITEPAFVTAAEKEVFHGPNSSGPIGPRIRLAPVATSLAAQSDSLFTELGSTQSVDFDNPSTGEANFASQPYKYIDTIMSVTGISTGYSIDIPIRLYKK